MTRSHQTEAVNRKPVVAPSRSSRAAWDKEENARDLSQGPKGEAVPQDVSV